MELFSIKGTFYNGTRYHFNTLHQLRNAIDWHKDRIKECEQTEVQALKAKKTHYEACYTVLVLRLNEHEKRK